MLTKLFAIIESIKILNQWWQLIHSSYTAYRIDKLSDNLDERQLERNMAIDAIKSAQRERDEEKIMYYSHFLSTGKFPDGMSESGVQSPDSERLSRL